MKRPCRLCGKLVDELDARHDCGPIWNGKRYKDVLKESEEAVRHVLHDLDKPGKEVHRR
jgi:hypothetical protein